MGRYVHWKTAILLMLTDESNPSKRWCQLIPTRGFKGTRRTDSQSVLEERLRTAKAIWRTRRGSHLRGMRPAGKGLVNKQHGPGAGAGKPRGAEGAPAAPLLVRAEHSPAPPCPPPRGQPFRGLDGRFGQGPGCSRTISLLVCTVGYVHCSLSRKNWDK